jgi:hypothetical protein
MMLPSRYAIALALSVVCCALPACTKPVELTQAVEVADLSTGWFDAGIVEGKNKLVPSVTFRLKKKSDVNVSTVSINVVFKQVGTDDHFDEIYVQRLDFTGAETAPITVRAKVGYTGDPPQTRADMLKNTYFKDMEAQIFAKAGAAQWVPLQSTPIVRQLLTK